MRYNGLITAIKDKINEITIKLDIKQDSLFTEQDNIEDDIETLKSLLTLWKIEHSLYLTHQEKID